MKLNIQWIAGYLTTKANFTVRDVRQYKSFIITINESRSNVELVKQIRKDLHNIGTLVERGEKNLLWSIYKKEDVSYFCTTFAPLLRGRTQEQCWTFMDNFDSQYSQNGSTYTVS